MPSSLRTSRVLVVSDSHLSPHAAEANANWSAAAALAGDVDLMVHVGDLTLNGTEDDDDLAHARGLLDTLPVPWVAVPGNHDIGDNPTPPAGPTVTSERVDHWRTWIGPDYWSTDVGAWTVVGIDAQLFGSGLDAEGRQWTWLQERLASQPHDRPVVLVTHKPITASGAELAASPPYRFVPSPARDRIGELLSRVRCPLVVSGHVHQYRVLDDGVRRHVWAPTTWAVLPERVQATVGVKRCGAISLDLDAGGTVRVDLVEPNGLVQLTLADDLPDPYQP